MTPDAATDLVRETLILCMIIAAPILLMGLLIGVIISIFQALTQIQEQTISLVPKLVAMTVVAVLLLPWMCERMMDFTRAMFLGVAP
jgi:flagellar biosynthesis protein FliQ